MSAVVGVGLDVGFRQTKIVVDGGATIVVPSLVHKVMTETIDGQIGRTNYKDAYGQYLVGQQALLSAAFPMVDSSYYRSEQYRVLSMYLLNEIAAPRVNIVAGLPVNYISAHRAELTRMMKGWSTEKVTIETVKVAPQPIGAVWDLMIQENGEVMDYGSGRQGVIDIGGGTIDLCEIADNAVVDSSYKGVLVGIGRAQDDVYDYIMDRYQVDMRRSEMDRVIREGGFYYQGTEFKDLSKPIHAAMARIVTTIKTAIIEVWRNTNALKRVIVVGGGADALRNLLPNIIPATQLVIPERPELSVPRGFAKAAKNIGVNK